ALCPGICHWSLVICHWSFSQWPWDLKCANRGVTLGTASRDHAPGHYVSGISNVRFRRFQLVSVSPHRGFRWIIVLGLLGMLTPFASRRRRQRNSGTGATGQTNFGAAAGTDGPGTAGSEIGRASCRERV